MGHDVFWSLGCVIDLASALVEVHPQPDVSVPPESCQNGVHFFLSWQGHEWDLELNPTSGGERPSPRGAHHHPWTTSAITLAGAARWCGCCWFRRGCGSRTAGAPSRLAITACDETWPLWTCLLCKSAADKRADGLYASLIWASATSAAARWVSPASVKMRAVSRRLAASFWQQGASPVRRSALWRLAGPLAVADIDRTAG